MRSGRSDEVYEPNFKAEVKSIKMNQTISNGMYLPEMYKKEDTK